MSTAQDVPVMYSAPWCGFCTRLKQQLDRAGVAYREVDVDADAAGLARLEEISGGEWVIPTMEFADGTVMVNPPAKVVAEKASPTA